ncbi:MAG: deoxyribodipyrimidine photo-lyase [Thermomonas sp.]|nr:deoxyribodipyrimidine photo-lyase [Thermomonas sp.]
MLQGPTHDVLAQLVAATGAKAVYWVRRYEPAIEARDAAVKQALRADGIDARNHSGALLFEPWQMRKPDRRSVQGVHPFWRTALKRWRLPALQAVPERLPAPPALPAWSPSMRSGRSAGLPWDRGFWDEWVPRRGRCARGAGSLRDRCARRLRRQSRHPSLRGTSRLSPHLHSIQRRRIRASAAGCAAREARPRSTTCANSAGANSAITCYASRITPDAFSPRFDDFPAQAATDAQLDAWRHTAAPASDRERGHAQLVGPGAQPGTDDRGQLPDKAPARALGAWRALVLGHAGGRGPRQHCQAGSGWPAPAPTPRPTTGCSAVLPKA